MTREKSVIVIGAGASGMVAAIETAKRGIRVTVLEMNDKPGKKIYATGNGRCNLTNTRMELSCFNGTDRDFISSVIDRFGYKDTMEYFSRLGLMFKDRNGYIYPLSGQASSVVQVLINKMEELDIKILCNVEAVDIKKKADLFNVITAKGNYLCNGVIMATGSMAGINTKKLPKNTGFDIAKSFDHKIIPQVPALTGLKCKNKRFYKISGGVRCDGKISIYSKDKLVASDMGELQLVDYGVSGIPAFQVCRHAGYSLRNKKDTYVVLDFMPEYSEEFIREKLSENIKGNPDLGLGFYLGGMLNNKLAKGILDSLNMDEAAKGGALKDKELGKIAHCIKNYSDEVIGTNDFQIAQVCAGGVSLKELNENMESKYVEDLYMTGELLDADGICGGYNLQWAWATGYIAGNNILKDGE